MAQGMLNSFLLQKEIVNCCNLREKSLTFALLQLFLIKCLSITILLVNKLIPFISCVVNNVCFIFISNLNHVFRCEVAQLPDPAYFEQVCNLTSLKGNFSFIFKFKKIYKKCITIFFSQMSFTILFTTLISENIKSKLNS